MTASAIRIAILLALAFAAAFGCLCSVDPDSPAWLELFILARLAGCAALCALASRYRRWRLSDPAIKALDRWLAKSGQSQDIPNPLKRKQ